MFMRRTHTTAPDAAPQTPARSRANHLLREFVLEPLLAGLAVALLLAAGSALTFYLVGGAG